MFMKHKMCNDCKKHPRKKGRTICSKCIYQKNKKNNYIYKDTFKRSVTNYRKNLRNKVIEYLGGKCSQCEWTDPRALQIDHINGGGNIHRKKYKSWSVFYKEILEGKHDNNVQLLCANHNFIKRETENELHK